MFPIPKFLLSSPVLVRVTIHRGKSQDIHIDHLGLSMCQHKVILVGLKVHHSNVVLKVLTSSPVARLQEEHLLIMKPENGGLKPTT